MWIVSGAASSGSKTLPQGLHDGMFTGECSGQPGKGRHGAQLWKQVPFLIRVMLPAGTGEIAVNIGRRLARAVRQSVAAQVDSQFGECRALALDALVTGSQHGERFVESGGGGGQHARVSWLLAKSLGQGGDGAQTAFRPSRLSASLPTGFPVKIRRVASRSPGMSHKQERQFGFLFTFVFALVAFWPLWPLHAPNLYWLAGAGAWLAAALIYPKMLAPLYKAWMAFGHVLGWINARIILGIVFFVVVMPIGLVMRLFGKDFLRMRPNRSGSYWVQRDQKLTPQSMRNQF